jgi:hypothetical protein
MRALSTIIGKENPGSAVTRAGAECLAVGLNAHVLQQVSGVPQAPVLWTM